MESSSYPSRAPARTRSAGHSPHHPSHFGANHGAAGHLFRRQSENNSHEHGPSLSVSMTMSAPAPVLPDVSATMSLPVPVPVPVPVSIQSRQQQQQHLQRQRQQEQQHLPGNSVIEPNHMSLFLDGFPAYDENASSAAMAAAAGFGGANPLLSSPQHRRHQHHRQGHQSLSPRTLQPHHQIQQQTALQQQLLQHHQAQTPSAAQPQPQQHRIEQHQLGQQQRNQQHQQGNPTHSPHQKQLPQLRQPPRRGPLGVATNSMTPTTGSIFAILAPAPAPVPVSTPIATPSREAASPDTPVNWSRNSPAGTKSSAGAPDADKETASYLRTRRVENPPDLAVWRQKLFDLDEAMILTRAEYETYFPWIDNVYSHRSTQRYKRKPNFVTHYFDCRMKGRPPGTKKSDDPNKKKRKRTARERDLCDVKIKITEYQTGVSPELRTTEAMQLPMDTELVRQALEKIRDEPFWTIQRINGNVTTAGYVGGESEGEKLSCHRHDLARSDQIKKSTMDRWLLEKKRERERDGKRGVKSVGLLPGFRATGEAAGTAKRKGKERVGGSSIKLFGCCFCPFSQRAWITLEAKGLDYQYCEVDPTRKNKVPELPEGEGSSDGLLPVLCHDNWTCAESSVILEYLEDLDSNIPLHPKEPKAKARCRYWINFINTRVVPSFFNLLPTATENTEADNAELQRQNKEKLLKDLTELVKAADPVGPYFLGDNICLVDINFAPFAVRLSRLLDWQMSAGATAMDSRLKRWVDALEGNQWVRSTMSGDALYQRSVGDLVGIGRSKGWITG